MDPFSSMDGCEGSGTWVRRVDETCAPHIWARHTDRNNMLSWPAIHVKKPLSCSHDLYHLLKYSDYQYVQIQSCNALAKGSGKKILRDHPFSTYAGRGRRGVGQKRMQYYEFISNSDVILRTRGAQKRPKFCVCTKWMLPNPMVPTQPGNDSITLSLGWGPCSSAFTRLQSHTIGTQNSQR